MVEPAERFAACSRAIPSACGRPPAAVAPLPIIRPLAERTMQPTFGLGADRPRASSPRATASPIHRRSSVNMELLCELFVLLLVRLLLGFLFRLVLFLVGDDLG